ncbi:hypothetical protein Scep_002100 [Stephania cephalantha]|uniref:Uncharacterized protein n=1 Tax=Stephania cephalantha TaxID=152367 RepID=A0AAP0LD54_9MAGN
MDANKTKKKKRRNGRKKKATAEQTLYAKSVREWVSLDSSSSSSSSSDSTPPSLDDDFGLRSCVGDDKLVFDLHSHSIFSDGFLSPTALVERAHRNGFDLQDIQDYKGSLLRKLRAIVRSKIREESIFLHVVETAGSVKVKAEPKLSVANVANLANKNYQGIIIMTYVQFLFL